MSAGSNVTLPCRGQEGVTDPVMVSWSCRGCGQPAAGGQAPLLVARYSQDGGVSGARAPRVRVRVPSFQLEIGAVSAADAGRYVCSVNNAPSADSITLAVQG